MSALQILQSNANPQGDSPLFNRLPAELRLLIYTFVFLGSQATMWFNAEFGGDYQWSQFALQLRKRKRHVKYGQCCYEHFDSHLQWFGGFSFLTTCRSVYLEAFNIYWTETTLTVKYMMFPTGSWHGGVNLKEVCAYLPAAIMENLGHLRNTALPILDKPDERPKQGDPDWIPTLLRQFPKLKSCAFAALGKLKGEMWTGRHFLTVPEGDNVHSSYRGVGPFQVRDAESPAAFIETRLGIEQSCGITILSMAKIRRPPNCEVRRWSRYQYCNWTTGMVYQSPSMPRFEDGFKMIMGAKPGSEWRECPSDTSSESELSEDGE